MGAAFGVQWAMAAAKMTGDSGEPCLTPLEWWDAAEEDL